MPMQVRQRLVISVLNEAEADAARVWAGAGFCIAVLKRTGGHGHFHGPQGRDNRTYDTLGELVLKCKLLETLYPDRAKDAVFSSQEDDMPH